MDFLSVPPRLQDRVLTYYQNMWRFHKSLGESTATTFISELSRPLQIDLKINLFKDMLMRIPFLQSVDTVVVEELLLRLKSVAYMTGDIIIRKGDPGDWMGFVSHGMIAVLDPNYEATDVVQRLLRVGSHFGEISLLHNQARASSLQALTWTQLEVVTQKSWREIEKLHPEEMRLCRSEIHRMLADNQQVA